MSVKSFIKEFKKVAESYEKVERGDYIFNLKTNVQFQIVDMHNQHPDTIILEHFAIASDHHYGQGKGTEAIKDILRMADKHQISIIATAMSWREEFSDQATKQWYMDRGFSDGGEELIDSAIHYKIKYTPKLV